jgi:Cysteine-rich secretory protein family
MDLRRTKQSTRPRRAFLAAVTLGLGLAACSSIGPKPVTPIHVDAGRAAGLISAYRAQNGLGPVGVDSRLISAAANYARAMGTRDKINHRIGGSLPKRVTAAGYVWGAAAENLAAGYSSLDEAMRGWKASSGHRKNLLNPNVTEIGIAAVATPPGSKKRNYWALILASPPPDRVASGPFGLEQIR